MIFKKIESTCGCTVVDKEINTPIMPNKGDSILAHFKMNEANGSVVRKIYILANTKREFYILRIKANVIK